MPFAGVNDWSKPSQMLSHPDQPGGAVTPRPIGPPVNLVEVMTLRIGGHGTV